MNTRQRYWNILCWNIRGINGVEKWDALKKKIEESTCAIICLQETKRESFDHRFIRNFVPRRFDKYDFIPSVGASGGIIVIWNSTIFNGVTIEKHSFAMRLSFTSLHNMEQWSLINLYGPCQEPARSDFISWLRNLQIDPLENWMILGDFNFYRSLEDRNRPGGNVQDIFIFNDVIGHLGLVELPIKGRSYTWSNMQKNPLLEQLDWFFTSINWTTHYPNTMVQPLARITSDHIPCKISIGTSIPRSNIFRFENFWPLLPGFFETVTSCWQKPNQYPEIAQYISFKLKL